MVLSLRTLLCRFRWWADQRQFKKIEERKGKYLDSQLVYAAYSRCPCGAGITHPRGCGPWHYWDCSDILTGRAIESGQPGAKKHTPELPFLFYDIKSERQPSARGATTRPGGVARDVYL